MGRYAGKGSGGVGVPGEGSRPGLQTRLVRSRPPQESRRV